MTLDELNKIPDIEVLILKKHAGFIDPNRLDSHLASPKRPFSKPIEYTERNEKYRKVTDEKFMALESL